MGLFRRTLTGRSSRQLSTSSSSNSTNSNTSSTNSSNNSNIALSNTTSIATSAPTPALPTTSPISSSPPALTLTKTTSRLTKTLTWGRSRKESTREKKLEDWARCDHEEWCAPTKRRGGSKRSKAHEEILKAWEWKLPRSSMEGGKSRSMFSGVSPGCSRMGSVDSGVLERVMSGGKKGSALRDTHHGEAPGRGAVVGSVSEE